MIMEAEPIEVVEGHGTLCILDESGDTRVQWDSKNPVLVEKAKMRFEELKGQGYLAYKISLAYKGNGGGTGEVITNFDPNEACIVMHKAIVGG
jgi:hypothetical protein